MVSGWAGARAIADYAMCFKLWDAGHTGCDWSESVVQLAANPARAAAALHAHSASFTVPMLDYHNPIRNPTPPSQSCSSTFWPTGGCTSCRAWPGAASPATARAFSPMSSGERPALERNPASSFGFCSPCAHGLLGRQHPQHGSSGGIQHPLVLILLARQPRFRLCSSSSCTHPVAVWVARPPLLARLPSPCARRHHASCPACLPRVACLQGDCDVPGLPGAVHRGRAGAPQPHCVRPERIPERPQQG